MAADTSTQAEVHLTVRRPPAGFWLRPRLLLSVVPFVLVFAVGLGLLARAGEVLLPFERITVVEGRLASKADFFADPQVQRILLRHHVRVHFTQGGSRDIARTALDGLDFVFPSGQPAGDLILERLKEQGRSTTVYKPFTSPIALGTYRDYAEALRAAGLATPVDDGAGPLYYRLNLGDFLTAVEQRRRWRELAGGAVASDNRITAWSPDICRSNSAATYMALVAFVRNRADVPQSDAEAERLANEVKPLVGVFGLPQADLFNSYVTPEGKGQPIVVVYEHQFLAYQAQFHARTQTLDRDRVLLYPSVNFRTDPVYIPLSRTGEELGRLITTEPDLRHRAVALGFRTLNADAEPAGPEFGDYLRSQGIPVPTFLTDVGTNAQLPRLDLLEKMITITGNCA
ncbi:hypothetical protein Dvina_48840 [Dactylosporangium vinaceum]|uniref:Secreted protein n=1 Tax=Dactylosporangium vinaceum TaxID=53362 RepID=A0ABV5LY69_9ACTN|nr:hypothetical protein [Dactylosporangium vinaceum]UAB95809.1 hypothetical protein Dvina_48840 [Dactylosporangium vinaceum]